jgi:hypothetical protein
MDKLCSDYTLVDGREVLCLYTSRCLYGRYRRRDDLDVLELSSIGRSINMVRVESEDKWGAAGHQRCKADRRVQLQLCNYRYNFHPLAQENRPRADT